jgi:hypothetical protein
MSESSNFESPEKMPEFSSKIELRFFRHDEKSGAEVSGDVAVTLTPAGKIHAREQATLDNIDQSMAFSSARERTQLTAGFHMAGKLDFITGTESISELQKKIEDEYQADKSEDVRYGKKLRVEPRLDYEAMTPDNPLGKEMIDAVGRKEWLPYLINQSDGSKVALGEEKILTYSDYAKNIAEIVEKYWKIAPRFDELVHAKPNQYESTLNRFFATHQGISESFLAKVIEKVDGIENRNKFMESLGNQGFGFSEGFKVDIVTPNNGGIPSLHIIFNKKSEGGSDDFNFDREVSFDIVGEIIREGTKKAE